LHPHFRFATIPIAGIEQLFPRLGQAMKLIRFRPVRKIFIARDRNFGQHALYDVVKIDRHGKNLIMAQFYAEQGLQTGNFYG
jgi:hypothetical protein